MLRSLWTSAAGMKIQQTNIDNISHNLANVNTTGYKTSRVEFQDLLYETVKAAGSPEASGFNVPTGIQIGSGAKLVATEKLFSQGNFKSTSNSFDFVIEGNGFFKLRMPDGEVAYTRDGSFHKNGEGIIVSSSGYPLEPQISVPSDATLVSVGADGTVSYTSSLEAEPTEIGKVELASFVNPSGLLSIGKNLYKPSGSSGEAVTGTPGGDGLGSIGQGFLEMSNVNIIEEMVNMIISQRAYETNSKAIKTTDQMMQQTNELIR